MTPLAHRVVKQLTMPVKRRTFKDYAGVLELMDDVHCFECSAVGPAVDQINEQMIGKPYADLAAFSFLPAPRIWVERDDGDSRFAFHVTEDAKGIWDLRFVSQPPVGILAIPLCRIDVSGITDNNLQFQMPNFSTFVSDAVIAEKLTAKRGLNDYVHGLVSSFLQTLAFINTPRLVARTVRPSHKGLSRALQSAGRRDLAFKLKPWTEIKLEITPHESVSSEFPAGVTVTGRKALHFCRQHIRVRRGRLEIVRAHWRGDPAVGICQSRYRVAV